MVRPNRRPMTAPGSPDDCGQPGRVVCPDCGSSSYLVVDGREMTGHDALHMERAPRKIERRLPHAVWCPSDDNRFRATPRNTTGSGCPHGMPTPGSCIDCMDDGNLPPPPKAKRAGWPFTAEHPGPCVGPPCPGIEPGDRIVRMSDGGYRHVGACEKVRRG